MTPVDWVVTTFLVTLGLGCLWLLLTLTVGNRPQREESSGPKYVLKDNHNPRPAGARPPTVPPRPPPPKPEYFRD